MADVLIIGVGNDLRSDDGAGRVVADTVEALGLAGVDVRSQSQLTPELAEAMAGRRLVVFVDADTGADEVSVRPVGTSDGRGPLTHHGTPEALLDLVRNVGTPPRTTVTVSIPAADLGLGFELSEATAAGVDAAVALVVDLVEGRGG